MTATTVTIERIAIPGSGRKTEGRWAWYSLVADGVDLGTIKGTWSVGSDRIMGRKQERWASFRAGGRELPTIAEAELHLIGRQLTVLNPRLTVDQVRAALDEIATP